MARRIPIERHRLAGVVEHDGQMGIFVTYLLEDLLGEYGRLGHGERRELAHLEARHVMPGRAHGDGCPAKRHGQRSWPAVS